MTEPATDLSGTSVDEPVYDIDEITFDAQGHIIKDPAKSPAPTPAAQTPPADKPPAPPAPDTPPAPASPPPAPATTTLLRSLLASYDITTPEIDYDDGTGMRRVKPEDLSIEDQADLINQLTETDPDTTAQTDDERTVLTLFRNGKLHELFQTPAAAPIAQWSDDEVMRHVLKQQDPALTDEELQTELTLRQQSKRYTQQAGQYRQQLIAGEQARIEAETRATTEREQQAYAQQLEADRKVITEAAIQLPDIHGFPLTDDIRNALLSDLIEVNEEGVSPFIRSLDNPQELIKLRYYQAYVPAMIQHFQNQLKAEYERGRQEVLKGYPTEPIATPETVPAPQSVETTKVRDIDRIIDFG